MSKQQDSALEVWLDDDLGPPCLVGTLAHDRGQIRFHYERTGSKTLAPLRWTPASPWTSTPSFRSRNWATSGSSWTHRLTAGAKR